MSASNTQVLEVSKKDPLFRWVKRPIITGLIGIIKLLQKTYTEELQLHGKENLLKEDGQPYANPGLWAIKHEVSADIINIIPYWMHIAPSLRFDFRSAMRNVKRGEYGLRLLDTLVLRHFTYHVHRTSFGEGNSPEEIEQLRKENAAHFQRVREQYQKGIHAIIFPEGTTKTDGTVFPIKSGCYNLAKNEREDGILDVITTIPVGLTYDHISGGRNPFFSKIQRKHVFVNIGKPFYYDAHTQNSSESDHPWEIKAQINKYSQHVREQLIRLNTLTVAQLAGEYVLTKAEEGKRNISKEELRDILSRRVEKLQQLPQLTFDDELQGESGRQRRIDQFWHGLEYRGFMEGDRMSLEKIVIVPNLPKYKKDNALRYCVNRLRQFAQYRGDVDSVLNETR
ncbi:hypothetical protein HY496_03660 [Candidatus Woesearchaeota archaeon]|nr:hypothetical protein [Candidatus Woesearchaeota archaeon]